MRRKRLQHVADILCHMFCGWRLISSKPLLVQLGSGELAINVVTAECRHNGQSVGQLAIADELRLWMLKELARQRIPLDEISEATLRVELDFSLVAWRDTGEQFFDKGRQVKTAQMHRCLIHCSSVVRTTETEYTSRYSDVELWPIGWPG